MYDLFDSEETHRDITFEATMAISDEELELAEGDIFAAAQTALSGISAKLICISEEVL